MKKLFIVCLLAGMAQLAFAQNQITDDLAQKRDVSGFHSIEVSTGIHLYLAQGNEEAVAVSAAQTEFRDEIVSKVENGVLKLYYNNRLKAPNSKKVKKDLKAYVTCKVLKALNVNTGAIVSINEEITSEELTMNVNTGGEVKGNISVGKLEVDQNTGSVVELSGEAKSLKAEGNTGSRLETDKLKSEKCELRVNTGAEMYVNAEKEIYAQAHTGATIRYSGNASIREIKTSTGGSVKKN